MMFERRLLPLLRPQLAMLLATVLSGFIAGLAGIFVAVGVARAVGALFLHDAGLQQIEPILRWTLLAAAGRAVFLWSGEVAAQRLAGRVQLQLRKSLHQKLMRLGPVALSAWPAGELSALMNDGVEALDAYLRRYLPQLSLAALVPLAIATYVIVLDPLSGLVLLLTAPLIPLFMVLIGKLAKARSEAQWQRLQRMSGHFLDRIQGLIELRSIGYGAAQADEIHKVSLSLARSTFEVLKIAFLSALVLELLSTLSTAIVAVEIGLRVLYARLDFVPALSLLLLAPEFYLPLRMLGARFHDGSSGQAAANKIFAFLAQAELPQAKSPLAAPRQAPTIEIRDLSFHYPARAQEGGVTTKKKEVRQALRDISLHIPAGKSLAQIGRSGSGKSSLAKLLLRFADPQRGQILVDGQDLRSFDLQDWRRRITWLSDRPQVFAGSIADNIRLACPDADDEAVHIAAKNAELHDFINDLPDKYETGLGENAQRLSGGQAQRLALARAFLQDPVLVILDELSAQLDPQLEQRVMQNTLRWLKGRSALIIAHRLSTVRLADQIAILDEGTLLETGSHEQLLAKSGHYARMLQAAKLDV